MNHHRDSSWLKKQLTSGQTPIDIANLCAVPLGTITDCLIKNEIAQPKVLPANLVGTEALQWCGQERCRIPAALTKTTTPRDNATVAVIGATGFVGTNLITNLKHNSKYQIIPVSRYDADVMDRAAVQMKLAQIRPDVVVNVSAFVGGIGLNKDNPADMIYRNLVMSANVIDACFATGVRKLISLGSVCSYPHTPAHIPFVENDLWLGRPESTNEPYGVAKKTIGLMLDAYKRQFNFSSAYLIPTNMYGPFDDFSLYGSHVIPAMIRKFLVACRSAVCPVVQWGDGTASRDFLYVDDCCEAIRLAIESVDDPEPINVGSGYECTMSELSTRIAAATGYKGQVVWDATKPNGQPRRCLDVSRAKARMGFQPSTDLQTGLDATVNWYIDNMEI